MAAQDTDLYQRAYHALSMVIDPELRKPLTELGMVEHLAVDDSGNPVVVECTVALTIAACPRKEEIAEDVKGALAAALPQAQINFTQSVMTPAQREELKEQLRGGKNRPTNPFTQKDTLTRIYAVVSGKGGVGKSSVTANLAAGMAARGLSVGVVDADVFGFSQPRLLGALGEVPTRMDEMILPVVVQDLKLISIGMFVQGNAPVAWRGPMLSRAIRQFLNDVYFGDLDVLLLDLPPGTGDIAITVAQELPAAELLVVTTPQLAATEVAERAGSLATMTQQKVAGVIENMSAMVLPDGSTLDIFGSGGGQVLADKLSTTLGYQVPLLGSIPVDPLLGSTGDAGKPIVLSEPNSPSASALNTIIDDLAGRGRGLVGKSLPMAF